MQFYNIEGKKLGLQAVKKENTKLQSVKKRDIKILLYGKVHTRQNKKLRMVMFTHSFMIYQ